VIVNSGPSLLGMGGPVPDWGDGGRWPNGHSPAVPRPANPFAHPTPLPQCPTRNVTPYRQESFQQNAPLPEPNSNVRPSYFPRPNPHNHQQVA